MKTLSIGMVAGWGAFTIASIGAWLTHILVCLTAGKWGFLIAGALLPPIGVIHGFGLWLGVWH